ncbi:hypothetical protein J2T12_004018 [Paenibacillus anaericanus]|uniref:hypothetical protein n=1 Tax=Paenibacillus anaericanus TaxID=170367 RepID=UPI0027889518|nr:hypothetical protein [Paenibacillus anaericanus]MDQ0090595.1 hypothetical protein [Paenibacillus anaericanus]
MIKNRHFMLGLGIGLIIGALLLQIMMIGQGSYKALTTVKEVQQAAAELNLKVVDNKVELLTEDEWRAKYPEDVLSNGDVEKGSTEDPVQPSSPDSPATPDSPVEPKTETDSSSIKKEEEIQIDTPKSPEVPEPVVVEYRIRSGATLAGVASGLKKAGVISDETAFIKKASAKGINRKLQVGTYKFTKEEDFNSIISKITLKSSGK